jgi:hypothetical protein
VFSLQTPTCASANFSDFRDRDFLSKPRHTSSEKTTEPSSSRSTLVNRWRVIPRLALAKMF